MRMIPLHIADQAVAACDAEIAKLREENARLKAEVERLELEVFAFDRTIKQASCHYDNRLEDIRQLQAHVERLTKAGDQLSADVLFVFGENKDVDDWNAAKEGKQP
jgi:cell division protein FtsB